MKIFLGSDAERRRRLEVLRVVSEIEKLWGLGFSNMSKIPNSTAAVAVTSALLE